MIILKIEYFLRDKLFYEKHLQSSVGHISM